MDIQPIINDDIQPIIVAICFCIGYILKHSISYVNNQKEYYLKYKDKIKENS